MAKLFLVKKSIASPPAPVAPTYITLSTQIASDGLEVGEVIATISSDGDAPVTVSEQADPDSKFTVSGNQLLLGAAIDYQAATSHSVTIRATNAAGYVDQAFTITVSDADGTFIAAPTIYRWLDARAATDDTWTHYGHAVADGYEIIPNNTNASTGITDGVSVYAVSSATNTFKLSATEGGSAIDVSAAGYGRFKVFGGPAQGWYLECECETEGGEPSFQWFYIDSQVSWQDRANDTTENRVDLTGEQVRQPLPYSEPNVYLNSCFIPTTVPVGKYVGCDVMIGGAVVRHYMPGTVTTIAGTAIGQANFASGVYKITSPGRYYLPENVTAEDSGVAILANDVVLNLNGHTLTFNNALNIEVPNGGFEDADPAEGVSWDWTGTGNPGAGVGTIGTPTYATVRHHEDAQRAYNTNIAWEGNRGVHFTPAAVSAGAGSSNVGVEHYIESGEFMLVANKWYTASAVFSQLANNLLAATTWLAVYDSVGNQIVRTTSTDWYSPHGPQHTEVMFKAVATPATYKIRIGVTGKNINDTYGGVLVDSVRIARGHTVGVSFGNSETLRAGNYSGNSYVSSASWQTNGYILRAVPWDISHSSDVKPVNCSVQNGLIRQGQGDGQFCAGVASQNWPATFNCVRHVDIECSGPVAAAIKTLHGEPVNFDGADSSLVCTHRYCGYRDYYMGSTVYSVSGTWRRNIIRSSSSGGIVFNGSGVATGNDIRVKTMQTNMFAIQAGPSAYSSATFTINDNVIDNTGDYYGRGVHFNGSQDNVYHASGSLFNNYIAIKQSAWNPTPGYAPFIEQGDYAVQLEELGGANAIEVYGNTLIANADMPALAYCPRHPQAICYRTANSWRSAPLNFHNNTLIAVAGQGGQAFLYGPGSDGTTAGLRENNTCQTNSGLVYINESNPVLIDGDTINLTQEAGVTSWPVTVFFGTGTHYGLEFRDVVWQGVAKSVLDVERPRNYNNGTNSGDWTAGGQFTITWTITFTGADGTAIQVRDKTDTVVRSGEIIGGSYAVVLPESTHTRDAINYHNLGGGYEYSVNGGAWIPVVFDGTKTIALS